MQFDARIFDTGSFMVVLAFEVLAMLVHVYDWIGIKAQVLSQWITIDLLQEQMEGSKSIVNSIFFTQKS